MQPIANSCRPGQGAPERERAPRYARAEHAREFGRTDQGGGEGRPERGPRPPRHDQRPPQQDRRRDKPVDPDSPFAKLAALKALMEAEKKGG